MSKQKYPGVYIEELSSLPPAVAQVETAIPAFIGYTKKAVNTSNSVLFEPIRISSLLEYERVFGVAYNESQLVINVEDAAMSSRMSFSSDTVWSPYKMYYALQLFFANGGTACYVISVGLYNQEHTDRVLYSDLKQGLDAAANVDEITLLTLPDATGLQSHSDYYRVTHDILQQCHTLKDRFAILNTYSDLTYNQEGASFNPVDAFRQFVTLDSEYLEYGACYFPFLKTVLNYSYKSKQVEIRLKNRAGKNQVTTLKVLAKKDVKRYNKVKQFIKEHYVVLPPNAAIAGVYSRVDASRGVWKAPANISLNYVVEPTVAIPKNNVQALYVDASTGMSINPIKQFSGRGTMVWGARTLAGNDNEWRYVPVRRFFIMVEESILKALKQFVFEINDANTWAHVKMMVTNFLINQWRSGALQGTKPEDGFFVNVGLGETMTAQDILDHKMIVEIGMAVVRPAEFIILRLNLVMQS